MAPKGHWYTQLPQEMHSLMSIEAFLFGPMEVADRESEELVEKGVLTSSCCPGFVGYVKKKHPVSIEAFLFGPMEMAFAGQPFSQGRWFFTMALY